MMHECKNKHNITGISLSVLPHFTFPFFTNCPLSQKANYKKVRCSWITFCVLRVVPSCFIKLAQKKRTQNIVVKSKVCKLIGDLRCINHRL